MDHPKSDRRELQRTVDLKAKLLAVLDQAEGYRVPAIRSRDRASVSPTSISWSCM
jgi:hypothetical protein